MSVVHLMLAERSRRSGPGSMVGRPVAEVVVVQVEEIRLSNPGGKLRLRRCSVDKQTHLHTRRSLSGSVEESRAPSADSFTRQNVIGYFPLQVSS